MTPKPSNYAVWPCTVPANATTELTVIACERAFFPREGKEYTLRINPVNWDVADYHAPDHRTLISAVAKDGAIKGTYAFGDEGAYWIDLLDGEKLLQSMQVYALEADLYGLRPLKGDLHGHSYRSDGKQDPAALVGHYREQGYDFFALTDHNRYYPSQEAQEALKEVKLGITVLNGEEVHTPGSIVHIVHVGGQSSVADQYRLDPQTYQKEYKELEAALPAGIPADLRERYAMAQWATQKIHRAGGLAIFPHPFWTPGSHSYNLSTTFSRLLLTSGFFDAYELIGGMDWSQNNMSQALWNEARAAGATLPTVGSSDVHALTGHTFANHFTVALAKDNTPEAIIEAVKKGHCIAVEAIGQGESRQYRCYGSLRLIIYVQFLLAHYFPCTQRICEGEGVMIRRYLIGAECGELLSACADRVAAFWRRFGGAEAPVLPGSARLEWEEKRRKIHQNGPLTKGSHLEFYNNKANMRQE